MLPPMSTWSVIELILKVHEVIYLSFKVLEQNGVDSAVMSDKIIFEELVSPQGGSSRQLHVICHLKLEISTLYTLKE